MDSLDSVSRADVRMYSFIPAWMLRFFPTGLVRRMYDKAMIEAVENYECYEQDIMGGLPLDFSSIAFSTVRIETEVARRRLERKPLNPHSGKQCVYATDVWADYMLPEEDRLRKWHLQKKS